MRTIKQDPRAQTKRTAQANAGHPPKLPTDSAEDPGFER